MSGKNRRTKTETSDARKREGEDWFSPYPFGGSFYSGGGEVSDMRKKENFRVVENVVVTAAPRLSERLALTTIAVLAVVGAVLIKAITLGEFTCTPADKKRDWQTRARAR